MHERYDKLMSFKGILRRNCARPKMHQSIPKSLRPHHIRAFCCLFDFLRAFGANQQAMIGYPSRALHEPARLPTLKLAQRSRN
jgi:hypothetical protein